MIVFNIIAQSAGVNVNATIPERMIAGHRNCKLSIKTPTGPDIKATGIKPQPLRT
jgi:hypothetical protein